jgi:hypothetical protein
LVACRNMFDGLMGEKAHTGRKAMLSVATSFAE